VTAVELAERATTNLDGDIDRFYCCDEDVAMCGLDLSGVPETPVDDPSRDCPLCVLVLQQGLPCPVRGCQP
jgi:hypothetical protein